VIAESAGMKLGTFSAFNVCIHLDPRPTIRNIVYFGLFKKFVMHFATNV
jgi:hypothetical protein